jgi:mannose-6-phosphate isomerase-like protein (cupin superfamily)
MKRLNVRDLAQEGTRILPQLFGDRKIRRGGFTLFRPGETAHPERHVHDVDEVFIFLQGRGVLPIDGTDHPIETGDVIVVEAGEDHHTTSSVDEPLVAAWYLLEPPQEA